MASLAVMVWAFYFNNLSVETNQLSAIINDELAIDITIFSKNSASDKLGDQIIYSWTLILNYIQPLSSPKEEPQVIP